MTLVIFGVAVMLTDELTRRPVVKRTPPIPAATDEGEADRADMAPETHPIDTDRARSVTALGACGHAERTDCPPMRLPRSDYPACRRAEHEVVAVHPLLDEAHRPRPRRLVDPVLGQPGELQHLAGDGE